MTAPLDDADPRAALASALGDDPVVAAGRATEVERQPVDHDRGPVDETRQCGVTDDRVMAPLRDHDEDDFPDRWRQPGRYSLRRVRRLRRRRRAVVLARPESRAPQDTDDTPLGRLVASQRPDTESSGIVALPDGRDAFAARIMLCDTAVRTLDVQYYIWHRDVTGTLMADAVRRAADRGVRVRMLIDDNNTRGLDPVLTALNAHPNIELRLFNPFFQRRFRLLGYLTDFARLNRRMHNKSLTADNQATIIGGRNIGDEYFGADDKMMFVDLDALAVGPVAHEVSADFDRYWACESAYPVDDLLPSLPPEGARRLADEAARALAQPGARRFAGVLAGRSFVRRVLAGQLEFEWTRVRMVSDDPAKGLGKADSHVTLPQLLRDFVGTPQRELRLVSAYFVPAKAGTQALVKLAERGVSIEVLTNSLAATDVFAVHAGYAKRRRDLLAASVRIHEMKPRGAAEDTGADEGAADDGEADLRRRPPAVQPPAGGSPGAAAARGLGPGGRSDRAPGFGGSGGPSHGATMRRRFGGSSASSLHAKTFMVDDERVFIGSFNFDPRSAHLNTEMGFIIDSPTMALAIERTFSEHLPSRAYQVELADDGRHLQWRDEPANGGDIVIHTTEPETRPWLRLAVRLLAFLPFEWML